MICERKRENGELLFNYSLSSNELKFLIKLLRFVMNLCPFKSYRNRARILIDNFLSIVFDELNYA